VNHQKKTKHYWVYKVKTKIKQNFLINSFQINIIAIFFAVFLFLNFICENLRFPFLPILKFEFSIMISLIFTNYLSFVWIIITNIIYSLIGFLIFAGAFFPVSNLTLILLNFFLIATYLLFKNKIKFFKKKILNEILILFFVMILTAFFMVAINYLIIFNLYKQLFNIKEKEIQYLKSPKVLFTLILTFNLLNISINMLIYLLFYFLPFKCYKNNHEPYKETS